MNDTDNNPIIVDYSGENEFKNALLAQGKGKNFLALWRLDAPVKRFDGKKARYRIEHRDLSFPARHSDDQVWACTLSAENTYWQVKEFSLKKLLAGKITLFDAFNLF